MGGVLRVLKALAKIKRFLLRRISRRRILKSAQIDDDNLLSSFSEFASSDDFIKNLASFDIPLKVQPVPPSLEEIPEEVSEESIIMSHGPGVPSHEFLPGIRENEGDAAHRSQVRQGHPLSFKIKTHLKEEKEEEKKLIEQWGLTKEETIRAFQKKLRRAKKQKQKHYIIKTEYG